MKQDEYRDLLRSLDDPVNWESPPGMDYEDQIARFFQFVSQLEKRLGNKLKVETGSNIQDASFHSEVLLGNTCLRFSNFGNMIAVSDDKAIPPVTLETVVELAQQNGYIFIPTELLEEEYDGDNPGVTGIRDWWIRYFDWV